MFKYTVDALDVRGYRNEAVPNTFFRQEGETSRLGIILPGWGYTTQMPVLYYSGRLLLSLGHDVLAVEYAYNKVPGFQNLPEEVQLEWISTDVTAACRAALKQRGYDGVTLVGKSLGTLAMGLLLRERLLPDATQGVWLTPALLDDLLRDEITKWGGRSLFVIGTADHYYKPQLLEEVKLATKGETLVVEGADHGLEIAGEVWQSLHTLQRVMRSIQVFLT